MVRPCHSTFFPCCFPKLFSVLGSAIYHSSAWQVSYIKYFMAWWSFSTSVTVPPESDISWSLNVFHTILMLHHGYLTMDKTGHNIMLLDMNLCIYSFKIVLKYIQAWKFRSCSPSENPCPWWKVHLFQCTCQCLLKARCIYTSHLNLKHNTSQEIIHVEIWMLETCTLENPLRPSVDLIEE